MNSEVTQYIVNAPEEFKVVLTELRENILELFPEAEEIIYYHMPTYKLMGKPVLVFAAFKNHCSLIVMRTSIIEKLKKELEGYEISGTTIHFTPGNPIPKEIIKKIVEERLLLIKS